MPHLLPAAPTVGEIARRHEAPRHRVEYVIRSRGISPISRAGNARIFSEAAVELIGSELRRIDNDRLTTAPTPPLTPNQERA